MRGLGDGVYLGRSLKAQWEIGVEGAGTAKRTCERAACLPGEPRVLSPLAGPVVDMSYQVSDGLSIAAEGTLRQGQVGLGQRETSSPMAGGQAVLSLTTHGRLLKLTAGV